MKNKETLVIITETYHSTGKEDPWVKETYSFYIEKDVFIDCGNGCDDGKLLTYIVRNTIFKLNSRCSYDIVRALTEKETEEMYKLQEK